MEASVRRVTYSPLPKKLEASPVAFERLGRGAVTIALNQNGYRLTPFYDVLSAYPYFGQGNIQAKKIKMAMKVHSKNSHYKWNEILPRYWPEHGKKQGIDEEQTLAIMASLDETVESALNVTLKEANALFDRIVGEVIAERTLDCLGKVTRFLRSA